MKEKYAILGGGIGGLTLAIALQRKGIDVTVYESAPQWKPLGAGIGLAGNAVKAFREIGIENDVLSEGKVIKKVVIRNRAGKPLLQTDSEEVSKRFGVVNNFAIHRADLHRVLISQLEPNTVELNKACVDFIQDDNGVTISFKDGSAATCDYLIAADGVHSVARKKLLSNVTPRYAGYTCWRGIAEDLPPGFDQDEASETWGPGGRVGIVPLVRDRVYWFACVNSSANNVMMQTLTPTDLLTFFGKYHQPIPELLRRTPREKIIWNDIIDIEPITQFAFGRVVLMGDAAHATTPNMGQGACMAIEDAAILSNLLGTTADVVGAFKTFEQKRIRRTTKIVNDSWQLGKMAQWDSPLMTSIRNVALSLIPKRVTDNQFKFIYDVSLR
jgi:2-polyprenyl-6-methoxyphenol hydroxylase-like FAD-dependent oxidoreductase